jgi:hypothetical protein
MATTRNKGSLNEFQKHQGWKEILIGEHRSMKESLRRCIEEDYTVDPDRARGILKNQFEDDQSDNRHIESSK